MHLIITAKRNYDRPLRDSPNLSGLPISVKTPATRRLKEIEFVSSYKQRKPFLTTEHKRASLEWTAAHLNCTIPAKIEENRGCQTSNKLIIRSKHIPRNRIFALHISHHHHQKETYRRNMGRQLDRLVYFNLSLLKRTFQLDFKRLLANISCS